MQFVHLHNHSFYSFLDGLSSPKAIIKRAMELGQPAVALTDHGSLTGAYKFYKASFNKDNKDIQDIKVIIGCEVYICQHQSRTIKNKENRYYHLVLLAENNDGYKNLIKLVTESNLTGFYHKPRIDLDLLRKYSNGLIALSACIGGAIPQALNNNNPSEAKQIALTYIDIFGRDNFFLEVQRHDDLPDQITINSKIIGLARELNIGLVATNDCHYIEKDDGKYRDELSFLNRISKKKSNTDTKEKQFKMADGDYSMLSTQEMINNFKNLPEAIENTVKIADRCNVTISKEDLTPRFETPNNILEKDYLKQLCEEGLKRRYGLNKGLDGWTTQKILPKPQNELIERYEYELKTISDLGFAGYFLIVRDYIDWAKRQGIYVGPAKGSAAGSLVSYLLGITEIDPLPYDLLFERFLNKDRKEMPDIDTDFQHDRRNEVIEYVRQKYGDENVSLVSSITTLASKNAIKAAARVQGVSLKVIQPVLQAISDRGAIKQLKEDEKNEKEKRKQLEQDQEEDRKEEEDQKEDLNFLLKLPKLNRIYKGSTVCKRLINTAIKLEGVARSTGTHACAVIISSKPIGDFTPLQRATSSKKKSRKKNLEENEPEVINKVSQYEAKDLAFLGCLKMDFLGIKTLTAVSNTLKEKQPQNAMPSDLNALPLDDHRVFEYLSAFNSIAIYQFESEEMQKYLNRLKPDCIGHLIAMNAMYRPGPMQYIDSFIKRKNGEEEPTYDHPLMEEVLKETYGITTYQEQVMRLAVKLAGFSQIKADDLRSAISKKKKDKLESIGKSFKQGCKDNGLQDKTINTIWNNWLNFAKYAFNKSHSTAYAILAYQTAYLKLYHPLEYMKNILNAYDDDFKTLLKYMAEAKRIGLVIIPPDINLSDDKFSISNKAIVIGFNAIKSVRKDDIAAIIAERNKGAFTSLGNLYSRVTKLKSSTIKSLALCGALESLCPNRRGIIHTFKEFSKACKDFPGVVMDDYSELQRIADYDDLSKATFERNLLGFYATIDPFDKHKAEISRNSILKPVARSIFNNNKTYFITAVIDEVTTIEKSKRQPVSILKVTTCYQKQETIIVAGIRSFRLGKQLVTNKIYTFWVTASIKEDGTVFFMQNCTEVKLYKVKVVDC